MKIKLKLLLLSMMFIGLGLSFCNAQSIISCGNSSDCVEFSGHIEGNRSLDWRNILFYVSLADEYSLLDTSSYNVSSTITCQYLNIVGFDPSYLRVAPYRIYNGGQFSQILLSINSNGVASTSLSNTAFPYYFIVGLYNTSYNGSYSLDWVCTVEASGISSQVGGGGSSCPDPEPSTINVLYNNENSSSTVTCNGDNIIQIDGLSTITNTNKRTPYFNIDYKDENNQSLIESYSKDILYLSGSLFKKTYTGNNERILTSQSSNNDSSFTGFVPTFDVVFTGDVWEDTGNVFNNFAQNSLQVALSNIPSYIQYVIIIMLLFFILGLARRKKRR